MSTTAEIVKGYFAMWNEPDAARRRTVIEQVRTPEALSVDPMAAVAGWAQIDAMVAHVHEAYPGYRFRLVGDIEAHHDRLRFRWEMQEPDGAVHLTGLDCVKLAADGRIADLTGFFDGTPARTS